MELERFRDSVGSTVDSIGLLGLERKMIQAAKADRANTMIHLKLGFCRSDWVTSADGTTMMTPPRNFSGPSTFSRPGPTPGTEWDWPSTV